MGKLTIYVPDELEDAVRRAGISMSPVCQQALGDEVRRVGLHYRIAIPVLGVSDMDASITYYTDVLGFYLAEGEPNFASIYRGSAESGLASANIYLRRVDEVLPSEVYVAVGDPERVFALHAERGADLVHPLEPKPWGFTEHRVRDPDGNELAFFWYTPEA